MYKVLKLGFQILGIYFVIGAELVVEAQTLLLHSIYVVC